MPPRATLVEFLISSLGKGCGSIHLCAYACRTGFPLPTLLLHSSIIMVPAFHDYIVQAFEALPDLKESFWTSFIVKCVEYGAPKRALDIYTRIQDNYLSPPYVALLKACIQLQDLESGINIHSRIEKNGILDSDVCIEGALVDMYAKCGCLMKAREILGKTGRLNVVLWTSLISGYVDNGQELEALECVQEMQDQDIFLDPAALTCALKVCGHTAALEKGQKLHAEVTKKGLLKSNVLVGTALVNMYMKCCLVIEAKQVFNSLPVHNVVSWTSLIAGYIENEWIEDAFACYSSMHCEGVYANVVTVICILKACGSNQAIGKGQELHMELCIKGLESDILISNTLIYMYTKCDLLETAQSVFNNIPMPSVVSWNVLIAGYAELDYFDEAMYIYNQMQYKGITPSNVTYIWCLKACSSLPTLKQGQEVHSEIVKKGSERDCVTCSILVDMYAKHGWLATAQRIFRNLSVTDVVSWNLLLRGFVDQGYVEKVLFLSEQMQSDGILRNSITYVCILKACSALAETDNLMCIHIEITMRGLEKEIIIANTLIEVHGKYGSMQTAQEIFNKLPSRDLISWNTLIRGYVDCGCYVKTINCLEQMQKEGISPDAITFSSCLKICGIAEFTTIGKQLHGSILKLGLECEQHCGGALVDMYCKCGSMIEARTTFEKCYNQTIDSWNAMIVGYILSGASEEALNCFDQLLEEGILFDSMILNSVIKACRCIGDINKGREVHLKATIKGLEREYLVGNILVDMYAKCGFLLEAQEVFEILVDRDVVAWTALIAGYFGCGHAEDAINCFQHMQQEGVSANSVTAMANLKACGSLGATLKGREIHSVLIKFGLESEPQIGNTLVDMYSKLGWMTDSKKVFDSIKFQDIVSWNALIAGYTQMADYDNVFYCLHEMFHQNIELDSITFVNLLNACTHAGLVELGQAVLGMMTTFYDCVPILEYFTCMIDLLGRAGHIEKATAMLKDMPIYPDMAAYQAILEACQKHGNVEFGRHVFEHAIRLDENGMAAAYTCMSNIYVHLEK